MQGLEANNSGDTVDTRMHGNSWATVAAQAARILTFIAFTGLTACNTLPTINPDMALRAPKPVQLEGANGPLSVKQSKAILAKLQKNGLDTNIFEHHLAIEQSIAGTPLVIGNKLTLLVDGPATYKDMFAA